MGIGAAELDVDAELVGLVVLGLLVSALLWWTYFGRDEEDQMIAAMAAADPRRLGRMGLEGFGRAHYVILLGVILAAVGIKDAIAHPGDELTLAYSLTLSGGVALFVLGDAWFRSLLGLGQAGRRILTGLAVLLAVPVAIATSAAVGLAATAALLGAALALEPA